MDMCLLKNLCGLKISLNNFIKIVFKNSFHAHVRKCMYF